MSQIDVNSVLSQMRALSAQASDTLPAASAPSPSSGGGVDFGTLLKQSVDAVASQQHAAETQSDAFQRGDPSADVVKMSIAGQKANLAFRGLVEVRNKLTDAYTAIMNMPV